MAKYISSWGPVITWCLVIFILSSIPTLPRSEIIWWDFIIKKSAHVIEYAILNILLIRAFDKNSKRYLLSFLLAFIYAATDEFHQSFVPGRTATIRDVGFDTLGIIFSLYAINLKQTRKN